MGRLEHRTAAGCTYFVTTKTWENRTIFQVTENAEILIRCMLGYRDRGAYLLHEFVVMPNHVYLLLTPGGETSLEKAMQFIKGGSSHQIHQQRQNKMQIWSSGFHEATIRDVEDFEARRHYVRMNPVEAGLAARPEDWACGSASGKFVLDATPGRVSSGAKAHFAVGGNVGAKAPTS
ncbi:MAG: transposase [Candidatus Acidoferrales bacterium]|nr:transposase [Candidatus Acidoferrales bacterium]